MEIKKNNFIIMILNWIKSFKRDHILIIDKNGEIIIESRVVDKDTIIISGRFIVNRVVLTITQIIFCSLMGRE